MLISLHLPKTAGSSFAATLEQHFAGRLLKDYQDFPMNTPVYERNRAALQACLLNAEKNFQAIDCIHGHFLPVKYLLLQQKQAIQFITWMRNPVDRIVSNYFFWQKIYNPNTSPPLHRRVIEENWSLEQFCLSQEFQNMYAQYLWAFPIGNFDFIGITEFYNEDFAYFTQNYLNTTMQPVILNSGAIKQNDILTPTLKQKIIQHHARDMDLYQFALERRSCRLSSGADKSII